MTILYLDAFSGISGDMTVGALLDLGLSLADLRAQLAHLPLDSHSLWATTRHVNGIAATKFDVQVETHAHGHQHRPFSAIRDMLDGSALEPAARAMALRIFTKLAEAEARVHSTTVDKVTFHEVGAVDSIVDIVGTAVGVTRLGAEAVYVSPLPLGSGMVASQHGPLPVPAPATVELLRGFPTRIDGVGELVTPTGAAIVAALATPGPAPEFRLQAVGYGAGTRVVPDRPNVLRLVVGERVGTAEHDEVIVLETNIDDLNPEFYDHVMERLFAGGARDVYLTPVQMKKNRPGILLTVVCAEANRERLAAVIFTETSAIGVRYAPARRLILARRTERVETVYGPVTVKIARTPDGQVNVAPEYDDCKRVAVERAVPIKLVYQAALAAALSARHQ